MKGNLSPKPSHWPRRRSELKQPIDLKGLRMAGTIFLLQSDAPLVKMSEGRYLSLPGPFQADQSNLIQAANLTQA